MTPEAQFLSQEMEVSAITNWMRLVPAEYISSDMRKSTDWPAGRCSWIFFRWTNTKPFMCVPWAGFFSTFYILVNGIMFYTAPKLDTWARPSFPSLSVFPTLHWQTILVIWTYQYPTNLFSTTNKGKWQLGQEVKFEKAPHMIVVTYPTPSNGFRNVAL